MQRVRLGKTIRLSLCPMSMVAVCLLLIGNAAFAADWPRWRGPDQTGVVSAKGLFGDEPFDLKIAWKRPLGVGYSGISIANGRVVTMFGDGESDYVVALDAEDGKELWRYKIAAMWPARGGSEGGPLGVPVIDGDTVFALGAGGKLVALRMRDGSQSWTMSIDEKLGAQRAHFGFATAPLVVGDVLLLQAGGSEGRSLVGIDKKTGATLWSAGDDSVGYQAPILTTLAARRQALVVSDHVASGLDPASGELLWTHSHGVNEKSGFSTAVPLGNDRFLLNGRNDAAAFRVVATDDGFRAEEIWRTKDFKGSFAIPVFSEGHVYGFNGEFLTCISADDGTWVWRSRPPGGQGLILVDGHLVILGANGRLVVARATPDGYEERAAIEAIGASPTYPSFADGTIFVRDTRDIAAVKVVRGAN